MNDNPTCGACGGEMTPENSRIHPEYFLHDACLPAELQPPKPTPMSRKTAMQATPGAKYWSIKASMESENYDDTAPRRPWQGVLRNNGRYLSLSHFCAENGHIDDDSNATALVRECDLFATEAEAWVAYRAAAAHQADHYAEKAVEWLTESMAGPAIKYIIQGHARDDIGPDYDWDSIYAGDETQFFNTVEEAQAGIVELRKSGPDFAEADFRVAEFDPKHP